MMNQQEKNMEKSSKRGRPKGITSKKSMPKDENYSAELSAKIEAYKTAAQIFYKHKGINDLYEKCGEIINFYPEIQKELLSAYHYFDPYYTYNSRCGVCVAEFLHISYRAFYKSLNEVFE